MRQTLKKLKFEQNFEPFNSMHKIADKNSLRKIQKNLNNVTSLRKSKLDSI